MIPVTRNYLETSHGKSVCDGLGPSQSITGTLCVNVDINTLQETWQAHPAYVVSLYILQSYIFTYTCNTRF